MIKTLRYFFVIIWFSICFFIFLPFICLRPFNTANSYLFLRFFTPVSNKILGLKQLRIRNLEKIDPEKKYIIVGNHQDNLDAFIFAQVLPPHTLAIGKDSLRFIPFFGLAYWLCGHYFIKRKSNKSALRIMQKVERDLKEKTIKIFMMPEGTRSHGKGMGPFKKGAFHLASRAGVSILPIVASSYDKYFDMKKIDSGAILLDVLDPIETSSYNSQNLDELALKTRNLMIEAQDRLDQEIALAYQMLN